MRSGRWVEGLAAFAAHRWIAARRRRYLPHSCPLSESERARFAPYFSRELLESARLGEVESIGSGRGAALLSRLGFDASRVVAEPAGLTVGEVIVLAKGRVGEGARRESVLFHELVHVAQYRRLGIPAFAREYVRGWMVGGAGYLGVPLEIEAYALQSRFDAGDPVDVEREVDLTARAIGCVPRPG